MKDVQVGYRDNDDLKIKPDDIVETIDVHLLKPVSRTGLMQKLKLTAKPDARKPHPSDQTLYECFGGDALLCFYYAGADEASGIEIIQYVSRQFAQTDEDFHLSSNDRPGEKNDQPGEKMGAILGSLTETRFVLEYDRALNGTTLTYYAKSRMEDCQADCANNPNCQGFTWIKAGTYNPNDAAMCYLIAPVTYNNPARGHISGRKR